MKTKLGYMALLEKMKPNECLKYVIEAEKVGMDMIWVDDHFFPFPPMTECGFAWCFMASALQATEKIPFSTGVTAPIMRYNPAIVAQAFSTMNCMYPGRVNLGVGTGEDLNETPLLGVQWPKPAKRLEMLVDAVDIIKKLWTSDEAISCDGNYCMTDVRLCTKDKTKIPIYFSGIGPKASKLAGIKGDHLITLVTNPKVLEEVVFPNFEAGAREAGKDPSKMERAIMMNFAYDPSKSTKKGHTIGHQAEFEARSTVVHEPEDFITYIDELVDLGFNHIVLNDLSPSNGPALEALKAATAHYEK
jgi:secondary-alcohol dehydrogenase (coenzyme-F420)